MSYTPRLVRRNIRGYADGCIIVSDDTLIVVKHPTRDKRLKRTLFNQRKQDRMGIFEEILFFKATNNTKTNKSLTFLLPVAFLWEDEGTLICIVCSFENEGFLENPHPVLFCLIKKQSL